MEVTRENLEAVAKAFANKIRIHDCLKFEEFDFVIVLSDELLNSSLIRAGNPVTIVLRTSEMVNAIQHKNAKDFNILLTSAMHLVPRMLWKLGNEPISNVLARTEEQKWKKIKDEDVDALTPRLLPANQIHFDIQTIVTAMHTRTDVIVRVKGHGSLEALKEEAHQMLSDAVNNPITLIEDATKTETES